MLCFAQTRSAVYFPQVNKMSNRATQLVTLIPSGDTRESRVGLVCWSSFHRELGALRCLSACNPRFLHSVCQLARNGFEKCSCAAVCLQVVQSDLLGCKTVLHKVDRVLVSHP